MIKWLILKHVVFICIYALKRHRSVTSRLSNLEKDIILIILRKIAKTFMVLILDYFLLIVKTLIWLIYLFVIWGNKWFKQLGSSITKLHFFIQITQVMLCFVHFLKRLLIQSCNFYWKSTTFNAKIREQNTRCYIYCAGLDLVLNVTPYTLPPFWHEKAQKDEIKCDIPFLSKVYSMSKCIILSLLDV